MFGFRKKERHPASRRKPDTKPIIKPEGRFTAKGRVRLVGDRSPSSVTSIRPEEKMPILPEMPYIPPA